MAKLAATFSTYDAVGNREDLTDIITNITPTKTPFVSSLRRGKAKARVHEWQSDELAAAGSNAHLEGDEDAVTASTPTTRLQNTCQILKKLVSVSGTQDAVDKAGRRSELAYQIMKRTKEIARDLEWAMFNNTAEVAGSAAVARQLKGVPGWITTNVTDKATVAIAETDIDNALEDIWAEGGDPTKLYCGSFNKRTISGFTTGVTKNLDANDKRLVRSVDIYESDFGVLTIVPDHQIPADDIHIIDQSLWSLPVLRPMRTYPLAKTGDSEKRTMLVELTLECRQEKGSASIINTATS